MKTYILTIFSDSSKGREYVVESRNAIKLAEEYGRCEGGETVIVMTKDYRVVSGAKYKQDGSGYRRLDKDYLEYWDEHYAINRREAREYEEAW